MCNLYTVREIAFLVGGPWKFNLVLEKSWKNVCDYSRTNKIHEGATEHARC